MNEKLTLQDLVDLLAQKAKISKKEADAFFKELFAIITENVYENEPVKIKDFGVFKLTPVSSRESVNVNTGEKIEIPAHYRLSFQPDKSLKELVNKPFASFETIPLDEEESAATPPPVPITEVSVPPIIKETVVEDNNDDQEIEEEFDVEDVIIDLPVPTVAPTVEEPKKVETIVPKIQVSSEPKKNKSEKADTSAETVSNQTLNNLSVSPRYVYSYTTSHSEALAESDVTVSNFVERSGGIVSPNNSDRFEDFEKINVPEEESNEELHVLKEPIAEEPILVPLSDVVEKELVEHEGFNLPTTSKEEVQDELNPRGLLPEYDLDEGEDYEEEDDSELDEDIDYDKIPDFYTQKPSVWNRIVKKIPIILFVIIALAAIVYSFFSLFDVKYGYENFLNKTNFTAADTFPHGKEGVPHVVTLDSMLDETSKKLDSLKNDQKAGGVIADAYTTTKGVEIGNVNKAEEKYRSQQNATPEKIGTEVLKSGLTLRNLAEKYYGQGVFWVYIYEENKNVISDPDNIPAGVTVNIPSPAKYEIDAKNKASRDEAKQLESQIISEARQKRFSRGGIR